MSNSTINYTLHLADTTLILSHRNSEWCGHGPILEQDIALTNISLDLIGQARNFYQYSAALMGDTNEDNLAYLRTEREFKNLLLVEQPNVDWGHTILRQFFYSQFQYLLYQQLQNHKDEQLAAIAAKAIKETTYHVRWSSEWVIRLGDGTAESRTKMLQALEALWPYTGEMFVPVEYENDVHPGIENLQTTWLQQVTNVLTEATLPVPPATFMQTGGKTGTHTEHLGYLLTDMQYLQRTYPGAQW